MTSRFGKTYNRKGGKANSKFEEVFSNKKPTLTTRWGETTFKAQLGTKRPLLKPDVAELSKRPRLDDSNSEEDPFGFDSDDESKTPITSSMPQSKANEGDVSKSTAVPSSDKASIVSPAQGSASSTAKFASKKYIVSSSFWYAFDC